MGRWTGRRRGQLKDFKQELARGRLLRRYGRGLRLVPVAQIVGSVGKAASMDRRFRYKSGAVDARLRRLREANAYGMVALPPVELYAINDEYYVVDGHHRVAVALENDQAEIDAYVTAYEVEYPAAATTGLQSSAIGQQLVAARRHLFACGRALRSRAAASRRWRRFDGLSQRIPFIAHR